MQYSRAQHVADGFLEFMNDPWSLSEAMNGIEDAGNGAMFAPLTCVSDWLHLWMLSGEAHSECGDDFGLYTLAVAIVFAAGSRHPSLIENLDLLPPQSTTREDQPELPLAFVASQEYVLPAALTADFFAQTRTCSQQDRIASVTSFLKDPETWRLGYNAHRG